MSLFLSSFTNRIDAKGRVSVPATFRAATGAEQFQGVVLYRSFAGKCIEGLSMSRMEQIANATDNMNLFDEKLDELTAMLFADARQLPFDVTGRIVLPPDLIAHAGIGCAAASNADANVLFVGRGRSFQIWEPAAFAAHQSIALEKLKSEKPNLILNSKF